MINETFWSWEDRELVRKLFNEIDANNNGELSFREVFKFMRKKETETRSKEEMKNKTVLKDIQKWPRRSLRRTHPKWLRCGGGN